MSVKDRSPGTRQRGSALSVAVMLAFVTATLSVAALQLMEQNARIQYEAQALSRGLNRLENALEVIKVLVANSPYEGKQNVVLAKSAGVLNNYVTNAGTLKLNDFLAVFPNGYLEDAQRPGNPFVFPGGNAHLRVLIRDEGLRDAAVVDDRYYQVQVQELDLGLTPPRALRTARLRVRLWPPFSDYDQFTAGGLFLDKTSAGMVYAGEGIGFGVKKDADGNFVPLSFDAIETPSGVLDYFQPGGAGGWDQVTQAQGALYDTIKDKVTATGGLIGNARELGLPERSDLEALRDQTKTEAAADTSASPRAIYVDPPAQAPRSYDTWIAVSQALGPSYANHYAKARITETGKFNTKIRLYRNNSANPKDRVEITVVPQRSVQILTGATGKPWVQSMSPAVLEARLNNMIAEYRAKYGAEYEAGFQTKWYAAHPLEIYQGPAEKPANMATPAGAFQDAYVYYYSLNPPDSVATVGNVDTPGDATLESLFNALTSTGWWDNYLINRPTQFPFCFSGFHSPPDWVNYASYLDIRNHVRGLLGGTAESYLVTIIGQHDVAAGSYNPCGSHPRNVEELLMVDAHTHPHSTCTRATRDPTNAWWADARNRYSSGIQTYFNVPTNLLALKTQLGILRTEATANQAALDFATANWQDPYALARRNAEWAQQNPASARAEGEAYGEKLAKDEFRIQYLDAPASTAKALVDKEAGYAALDATSGLALVTLTVDGQGQVVETTTGLTAARALYEERFANAIPLASGTTRVSDVVVPATVYTTLGIAAPASTPISKTDYGLVDDAIIYVNGDVTSIFGQVGKKVTVVADGKVIVTGDITMQDANQNVLGIIAEQDILLAKDLANPAVKESLTVHAALLSRTGQIGLPTKGPSDQAGYHLRNPAALGDLYFSGSRVFATRWIAGTAQGAYANDFSSFNDKLEQVPPPHFFQSSRIDFLAFELVGDQALAVTVNP